jgi:tetratricopeptide (TPR) repeat protein
MGNIYYTMGNYNAALKSFQNSRISFTRLNDSVNLVVSMQNLGNVYYKLRNYEESEHTLLEAISKAKKLDLNNSIASMSIFLSNIYIDKKDYKKAEQLLIESEQYVKHSNDLKLEQDFLYTSYHFEDGRKNYYKALQFLKKVYKKDSIANNATMTEQLTRQEVQFKERAKARENELIIARQKNNKILFWASSVVSALLLVVVGLLYYSNTRKIKTNKQLTILNSEILQQKEELDWINQRLEKIIDERTKDLQIKNQKLSEYSWHLSHQIRGPVATMKGLMLLEKDRLIENDEFVIQLGKCLVDIDEKITNINEALHDVKRERLGNSAAG